MCSYSIEAIDCGPLVNLTANIVIQSNTTTFSDSAPTVVTCAQNYSFLQSDEAITQLYVSCVYNSSAVPSTLRWDTSNITECICE